MRPLGNYLDKLYFHWLYDRTAKDIQIDKQIFMTTVIFQKAHIAAHEEDYGYTGSTWLSQIRRADATDKRNATNRRQMAPRREATSPPEGSTASRCRLMSARHPSNRRRRAGTASRRVARGQHCEPSPPEARRQQQQRAACLASHLMYHYVIFAFTKRDAESSC